AHAHTHTHAGSAHAHGAFPFSTSAPHRWATARRRHGHAGGWARAHPGLGRTHLRRAAHHAGHSHPHATAHARHTSFACLRGRLFRIFLDKLHLDFHGLAQQRGQVGTFLLLNRFQVLGRVVLALVAGAERKGHAVLEA